MTKLIYIGAHDAVDVQPAGAYGPVLYAERNGTPIDVAPEHAERMLEQSENWRLATPHKSKPPKGDEKAAAPATATATAAPTGSAEKEG